MRKRLGQLLIDAGQLKPAELEEALDLQRELGMRVGHLLVRLGYVREEALTSALSRQLNVPAVNLDGAALDERLTRYLPLELVQRYRAFPLGVSGDKLLRVATSDPRRESERELSQHTGMRVYLFVTGENALERAIRRYYPVEKDITPAPVKGTTEADLAFTFPSRKTRTSAVEPTAELKGKVARLEKLVVTQNLALRGMLEMLDAKGVIRREALLDQLVEVLSGKRPPPLPLRRGGKSRSALRPPALG